MNDDTFLLWPKLDYNILAKSLTLKEAEYILNFKYS